MFRKSMPFVAAFLFMLPQNILAQQTVPVEVVHQGNENIGPRLVYQVKESIRKSSALKLTKDAPRLILHLTSLDINPYSTAIGIVVSMYFPQQPYEYFLYSGVTLCPVNGIKSMSEKLIAIVDDCADDFRKLSGAMP